MGGDLVHTEPKNCEMVKANVEVWQYLCDGGLNSFIEACCGFDLQLSLDVAKSWRDGMVKVGKLRFRISIPTIAEATGLRQTGRKIRRNAGDSKEDVAKFPDRGETLVRYMKGWNRKELPPPWDELCRVLMRYVTLEGRHTLIYGCHFALMNHFRRKMLVCFPFFIAHSMESSIVNFKNNKADAPLHQGVILLVYKKALADTPSHPINQRTNIFRKTGEGSTSKPYAQKNEVVIRDEEEHLPLQIFVRKTVEGSTSKPCTQKNGIIIRDDEEHLPLKKQKKEISLEVWLFEAKENKGAASPQIDNPAKSKDSVQTHKQVPTRISRTRNGSNSKYFTSIAARTRSSQQRIQIRNISEHLSQHTHSNESIPVINIEEEAETAGHVHKSTPKKIQKDHRVPKFEQVTMPTSSKIYEEVLHEGATSEKLEVLPENASFGQHTMRMQHQNFFEIQHEVKREFWEPGLFAEQSKANMVGGSNASICGACSLLCLDLHSTIKNLNLSGLSFFKVMERDFSSFLEIPIPFKREDEEEFHVVLMGQSGRLWTVKLCVGYGDLASLRDGWESFASDHSLSKGDVLVFNRICNTLFVVQVFGSNGHEKYAYRVESKSCVPDNKHGANSRQILKVGTEETKKHVRVRENKIACKSAVRCQGTESN